MKFNIRALLVGAALIVGMQGAVQAVSPDTVAKLTQKFEFFNQLPKEVQAQIIGLLDAGSFEASMKQLSKLRLVSKQMRDLIDSEYTGKQIIDMIYQRYQNETSVDTLVAIALKQNSPSSYAWLKDLAIIDPIVKSQLGWQVHNIILDHPRIVAKRELTENELKDIERLISLGANANEKFGPWTLLTLAATLGDFEVAKLLLDAGADINHIVPKVEGMENFGTALDLAIKHKDKAPKGDELIELLQSKGAKTAAELGKK